MPSRWRRTQRYWRLVLLRDVSFFLQGSYTRAPPGYESALLTGRYKNRQIPCKHTLPRQAQRPEFCMEAKQSQASFSVLWKQLASVISHFFAPTHTPPASGRGRHRKIRKARNRLQAIKSLVAQPPILTFTAPQIAYAKLQCPDMLRRLQLAPCKLTSKVPC